MTDPIAPALDPDDSNYAHCRVIERLPIPADQFFDWYIAEPIENFMLGTFFVSPIIGTRVITEGPFGSKGTARHISFKDGTVAYERVTETNYPHGYSYQPYAYDNPIRLFSDYAKATMTAEPDGDGCRIVWDYAFHAKNKAALQVVKLFVKLDWARNLANGLKVIRAHMEKHGVSRSIRDDKTAA